jgi:hypothetical protein
MTTRRTYLPRGSYQRNSGLHVLDIKILSYGHDNETGKGIYVQGRPRQRVVPYGIPNMHGAGTNRHIASFYCR